MVNKLRASIAFVFAMSALPFVLLPQPAEAGGDGPQECYLIGESVISCPNNKYNPPVAINYRPPFSEEPGRCLGQIIDFVPETNPITLEITGSFGGCPHKVGDRVTFEADPFFVLPESAIGAIAMSSASLAALAGYAYFKSRKSN